MDCACELISVFSHAVGSRDAVDADNLVQNVGQLNSEFIHQLIKFAVK